PEDLLRKILEDAVETLEAQRGAIALWDTSNNKLQVRAISDGKGAPESVRHGLNTPSTNLVIYSHSMAKQCLEKKESILYQNEDQNIKDRSRSIAEGVMNSILCVHLRTPRKTIGILHLDRGPWQKNFNRDDLQLADALGAQVSAGIECAQLLEKQKRLFLDTVTALAQSVEMRDPYTGGHTQRVTAISLLLAKAAKLTETEIEQIRIGTPLHDIGKIGIDDAILRKPGRLTDEEMENMRSHTTKGAAIVTLIPDLRDILPIVRSHHERYDGKGYPDGLKGENIPRVARAVAIADTFDAMASDRPYRKGLPLEAAFKEIEKFKGVQFDPVLAEIFLTLKGALQVYPNLKIPN
ncbi:MAG: HD domain-containing protein, partial [Gemmataceae bacterium]|nr:HD domain-containing protein [Gemmataceae bacterium]